MTVTRLPTNGIPHAISESGVIVGEWAGRAVVWPTTTTDPVALEDLGSRARATDVNDHGIAVGVLFGETGHRPVAWDVSTGALRDLSVEVGLIFGENLSINDRNEVWCPRVEERPNVTGTDGNYVTIDLDTDVVTEIFRDSEGQDSPVLNERGEVGWFRRSGGLSSDLTDAAVIVDLDQQRVRDVALPEGNVRGSRSFNDRGQLAVNVEVDGVQRPHLWDPVHGWTDLGAGDGRGLIVGATNDVGEAAGVDGDGRPWVAAVRYAPLEPRSARAVADGDSVALAWEAPLAEGDAPVDLYRVYRNGILVVETPDLHAVDESVDEGVPREVAYTVSAVNAYGESELSEPVTVTVGSAATDDPTPAGGSVTPTPSAAAAAASGVPRFTG